MSSSGSKRRIVVKVAYATPARQTLIELEVAEGATVAQVIALSGMREAHPEIDSLKAAAGIFGKVAPPDTVLREGDRVEIYRPLQADPKEVRRRRAGKRAGKKKD